MAKRVITTTEFTDDLDGSRAEGTTTFTVDGKTFEIDLSKKNRASFDRALKPFVDAARTVRGARIKTTTGRSKSRSDLGDIREWARSAGYAVSDRGRISAEIVEAYDAR